MKHLPKSEVWFVTAPSTSTGPGRSSQVAANSRRSPAGLNAAPALPLPLVFKAVLTTADAIRAVCLEANHAPECAGLVLWMHTFSPSRMWIGGLSILRKPFAHLHTQFNRDLPWARSTWTS
jgi:L-arabinose isomerase